MKITSLKDSGASYEKREFVRGVYHWCFVRNNEVIRWLDSFEVDKIESAIAHKEDAQQ